MLSLEESLALYPRVLQPLGAETIAVIEAAQRVLTASVRAATDLPRFDQSAMDGYALLAADCGRALATKPVRLPLAGESAAGPSAREPALPPGSAMRIFTGARVPLGADTVIAQERAVREGDALIFNAAYPRGKNIRYRGEELRRGQQVAAPGQRITPGLLAALVNAGIESVNVHRRPRIAVLVTGDEVRPPGTSLQPGEIPDSNGALIRAQLAHWGYSPPAVRHLPDREAEVVQALGEALAASDIVVSTGGASVGEKDFIPAAAARLGVETIFWKIAQKPGKPIFFGRKGAALLLGLPGNPASVLVGLQLHLRRVLDCLEGQDPPGPLPQAGKLAAAVSGDAQRAQLLRVRLEMDPAGQCWLQPLPKQESHMLSNLAAAGALAIVPPGDEVHARGTVLNWIAL